MQPSPLPDFTTFLSPHPQKTPSVTHFPSPGPWKPLIYFLSLDLPILDASHQWNPMFVTFCAFLSLGITFSSFLLVVACVNIFLFFFFRHLESFKTFAMANQVTITLSWTPHSECIKYPEVGVCQVKEYCTCDFFFFLFWPHPVAHGHSWPRERIWAAVVATPDPLTGHATAGNPLLWCSCVTSHSCP